MTRLHLHLDADVSMKALHQALLERGHDVTRTPNEWVALDASDEQQLLRATTHGGCLFTFNVRDFQTLAARHPFHAGIIVAAQNRWTLGDLIAALNRVLAETDADAWVGQVRWLNEWRGVA
ncbi:MAG: DUF5615 family PIN-like protein [Anaerolineae bacterium]|nr:DUF5615 family PIN-like protein [Anaerolineae bacterium]